MRIAMAPKTPSPYFPRHCRNKKIATTGLNFFAGFEFSITVNAKSSGIPPRRRPAKRPAKPTGKRSKKRNPNPITYKVVILLVLLVISPLLLTPSVQFVDWIIPLVHLDIAREHIPPLYENTLNLILEIIRIILTAVFLYLSRS
jgi:hypothetical protein